MLTVQSPASSSPLCAFPLFQLLLQSFLFPSLGLAQQPAECWLLFIQLLALTTFLTLQSLKSAHSSFALFRLISYSFVFSVLSCFSQSLISFLLPALFHFCSFLSQHFLLIPSLWSFVFSAFLLNCHHTLIFSLLPHLISCTSLSFFHPLILCLSPPLSRSAL